MNDSFLRACRGEVSDTVPVWFMRQAGRYQPEYRALRQRYGILDLVEDPELCCQVTALPVEQLGVDAAILFSDIMVPLGPLGIDYQIKAGIGPVLARPLRRMADLEALRALNPAHDLPYVGEAIGKICRRLDVPLIGFAGGPFTLASYLIEGGPSRQYQETKRILWSEPALWQRLMEILSDMVITYAGMQVAAGAHCVQLFDSWAGSLSLSDFQRRVLPYLEKIFTALAALRVPRIYFAVGAGHLLEAVATLPVEVISVDWREPLSQVRRRVGGKALQGNLDPVILTASSSVIEGEARAVLEQGRGGAHIFNLGHGVLPTTEVQALRHLVEVVHQEGTW